MDKRYYISRLFNGSNLSITGEKRDSKGDKYILIHMESGKSYKDFRYCFNSSSLKLLDKSGKENIDIKFFEVIVGMCIKKIIHLRIILNKGDDLYVNSFIGDVKIRFYKIEWTVMLY